MHLSLASRIETHLRRILILQGHPELARAAVRNHDSDLVAVADRETTIELTACIYRIRKMSAEEIIDERDHNKQRVVGEDQGPQDRHLPRYRKRDKTDSE